jgi:hypothetical protein
MEPGVVTLTWLGMPPGVENCRKRRRRPVASRETIDLRVRALEVDLRHDGRPAVPGTGEIDHVGVVPPDEPVQVDVDEALAR